MAIIGNNNLSLLEVAKRENWDGSIADIIELLMKINPLVTDATVTEGNLPTGNRTTVRTGLPTVAWRMLNYGVQPSKSQTVQVDDSCGMLEAYSEVDKRLLALGGNEAAIRLSEATAFLESMNNTVNSTIIYGNQQLDPKTFTGLTPRYSDVTAPSGRNIINGGGTGAVNTSIWFVTWGPHVTQLIYPKGTTGGLKHEDLGQHTLIDAAGGRYEGMRDHWTWDVGLTVRDWRYNVRICNIDTSMLSGAGTSSYTGAQIINLLVKAMHRLETIGGMGNTVIYANRDGLTALDLLALNNNNNAFAPMEYAGQMVTAFRGIPIRLCEAILSTEATVTGTFQ